MQFRQDTHNQHIDLRVCQNLLPARSITVGLVTVDHLLQRHRIDIRDVLQREPPTAPNRLEDAPVFRTRVDWYVGFAVCNRKAAARLYNVAPMPLVV